ncbi:transposase, partial [Desulfobulbus sp. F3]|nr:transposase [Desulfobulbus sp. F3]
PEKLIGGKAYDSDKLDAELLKKQRIEMIAPRRRNRTKPKTQDGRKLRRYKRRWKVERLFAWLQNFRRRQSDMSVMLIISWLFRCLPAHSFCFVFLR